MLPEMRLKPSTGARGATKRDADTGREMGTEGGRNAKTSANNEGPREAEMRRRMRNQRVTDKCDEISVTMERCSAGRKCEVSQRGKPGNKNVTS